MKNELGQINLNPKSDLLIKGLDKKPEGSCVNPCGDKSENCWQKLYDEPAPGETLLKEFTFSDPITAAGSLIAEWTCPSGKIAAIEYIGMEDLSGVYANEQYFIKINNNVLRNIDAVSHRPYGARYPDFDMFESKFILKETDKIQLYCKDISGTGAVGTRTIITALKGTLYNKIVC